MARHVYVIVAVIGLFPTETLGQLSLHAPDSISFQGYVTDLGGQPVTETVDITTTLYRSGVEAFSQLHPSVAIDGGVFNVVIGPVDAVLFDRPIEIGIQLGEDPQITPRTPLQSVPFALGMRGMRTLAVDNGSRVSYNVVGGGSNNFIGNGVTGATISGGGGWTSNGGGVFADSVVGDFGVVGGGVINKAGEYAFVGGGAYNKALGQSDVIGGGGENVTNGGKATISGGYQNSVTGNFGAVGGGSQNRVRASNATVPGGEGNQARGISSFASGRRARAKHDGTFVWNDRSADSLVSTGANQFLIRAAGGVGIGTNSPGEQLHILKAGGATAIKLGGNGTPGPNGIVFEDDADNAGVQLFWRTGNNQFILERSSQGTGTDGDNAFMYDRDDQRFVFTGSISQSATFSGHLVGFDNTASGSPDGIAIKVGESNAGAGSNFISFFDGDGDAYGRIEGNGTDGVAYLTTGGDYGEYIVRQNRDELIEKGDLVAVINGAVTRSSDYANRFMVVTDRPAMMGNMPRPDAEHLFERIAFVGQVPANVIGRVQVGDYIVPSGQNDGTGIALSAGSLRRRDLSRIAGIAWESSDDAGLKKVMVEVGLDRAAAVQAVLENEIDGLRLLIQEQQDQLDALMAQLVN